MIHPLLQKLVEMFFGKQKEKGRKLEETPPMAPSVPKKVKVVRVRPAHVARERNVSSRDTVSKRRRKQRQGNVVDTSALPLQDNKLVIMEIKEFHSLLVIDKFIPPEWKGRQPDCIKTILYWVWKSKAIAGGYVPLRYIKAETLKKFKGHEFSQAFNWLEEYELIKWQTKGGMGRKEFFSLQIKLPKKIKHAETPAFRSAIMKAFFEMNISVGRI